MSQPQVNLKYTPGKKSPNVMVNHEPTPGCIPSHMNLTLAPMYNIEYVLKKMYLLFLTYITTLISDQTAQKDHE